MGSKWLQRALSLVFATVGVGSVGGNHRPKGGRHLLSSLQCPWRPWCALSQTFPTFVFCSSPLALAVAALHPGMTFLASEGLSAHLEEDVWGSWREAGCLCILHRKAPRAHLQSEV